MLFINVYSIESFSSISWDIVIYGVVMLVVIFILGLGAAVITTKVPQRRGVILQCTFRGNIAIIGLPLASALGGEKAMAVSAIVSSFTVPVNNILAKLGYSPSDAIVVGDMPVDILMARNASVCSVGVTYGNSSREELLSASADYVVDSITELLDIVTPKL